MAVIEAEVVTMQAAPVQMGFDYGQIDEGIRDEVKEAARSIHQLGKAMKSSIIGIGKRLIEVKGMLAHGQFGEWIAAEFDMSERTAERMMNVARKYELKSDIVSFLSDTVLYMLAAPGYPEDARVEVEQAAIEGKKVTVEFAKEAKQKRQPEPVNYAKIYQLEKCVSQWLKATIGEEGLPDADAVLASLREQVNEPHKSGNWLSMLCQSLLEAEIVWRKADLTQAINNVREQRLQAARQAQARKVYVEPVAKTEPEPVAPEPTSNLEMPDDLKRWGYSLRMHVFEKWGESWGWTSKDGGYSGPGVTREQAIVSARQHLASNDRVTRFCTDPETIPEARHRIIMGSLMTAPVADINFHSALLFATAEQLTEALDVSAASNHKSRCDKIQARLRKVERERPTIIEPDATALIVAEPEPADLPQFADVFPPMPHDLDARGFEFARVGDRMWAIFRAEDTYTSNWHFEPADCIADVRSYLQDVVESEPQPAPQLPALVELMIDPVTDDTTTLPNSLHWAIKQATANELNEALRLLPDGLATGRGPVLEAALKKRGGVAAMVAERVKPDPRLEDARALLDLLVAARDTARAHYGELTGQHTDMLEFERGVAAMLPPLESLIAILEGTK